MEGKPKDSTGIPQRLKPGPEIKPQSDLETSNFKRSFDVLAREENTDTIINRVAKKADVLPTVIENWLTGMHIPTDRMLRSRIIFALETLKDSPVNESIPAPVQRPETIIITPKFRKKPGPNRLKRENIIKANEEQLKVLLARAEERKKQRKEEHEATRLRAIEKGKQLEEAAKEAEALRLKDEPKMQKKEEDLKGKGTIL